MKNNKSDFRRFCETMWIMVKYDVLPWVCVVGICVAAGLGVQKARSANVPTQKTISVDDFQKQR